MLRYKKNPGRKSGEIEVDGKLYKAKYIGKGSYSKVFRVGDRVVYYTRGDCGKEVLAQLQYDRMMHLPEIVRHENITVRPGSIWYVFSSPYYRNVTKKDGSAYKLMKRILQWHHVAYSKSNAFYGGASGIDVMLQVVNDLKNNSDLPRSIINAMREIVEVASNCGAKVGFDLHQKNFGVNQYGVLIFRDPIYVRE